MKSLKVQLKWFASLFTTSFNIFLLAALLTAAPFHAALAATAPSLGTAQSFAVLGGSAVTNTGPTIVTGDLGVSPGSAVTGFPPGIVVGGTIHVADAVALQAQSDTTTAYNNLAGQACDVDLTGTDLGGLTLLPGVYCFSSSAQLTGTLTLDAQGDPDAVWVFQIGSTLTTASNSSVLVINGGQPCHVFWQVGSSATLGTNTAFIGNILALTSITLNTDATLAGRALAQNGAVTMDSNTVTITTCAVPPVTPIPPTLNKAFSPATINAGGVSTLTITLSNPDSTAATLTAPLIDTLPSGVVVAPTPNASTTCGGTVTAVAGSSTITLAAGNSIPATGSCTVTVDVIAAVGGNYINSLAVGALQTSNGSNAAPAVATLTVLTPAGVVPPTIGKAFNPATINAGGISTLTITLSNTDDTAATLTAPLIDTLPTGVLVAPTPNASTTCGGTVTAVAGSSTVTLASGNTIPANGSCTVTVDVIAAVGGSYINSLAAGALQTSNGSNAAPAIATLTVITPAADVPPTLGKAFSPATIAAGGISTLTITLSNTSSTIATLTAPLIDTLPSGLLVAPTPNASTTCGGTVTAVAGSSTVTLAAGNTIPANGSCTVTVDVIAATGGNYINSLAAGALQTNNGSNAAPAIATLTVTPPPGVVPPTLGKAFDSATIVAGEISTLTITLSNTNSTAATLSAPLIDTLPSGLLVAPTPNASTTCDGGTVTAVANASTVTLSSGSTIPANGSCTVTVDVIAAVGGSYFNSLTVGALQTNHGFNAAPAVATLTVTPVILVNDVPTISKTFTPSTINAGGISTVTITLTNPGNTAATLTAPFIDTLPSGLVVAGSGANASTTSGTLTAITGQSTVTLTGATIPANGSVIIKFDVYAAVAGTYVNTLPSGTLQTSIGNNSVTVTATLIVNPREAGSPKLCKIFSPTTIKAGGVSTLTITLSNPNSTAATLIAPLTDYFPSGLVVAGTGPNASTTCGGTLTAITGATKIILTGGSIPANSSCRVKVDVTANNKGSYYNKLPAGALQTNKGSNASSASATLTVLAANIAPTLGKAFSPSTIKAGGVSTLSITLSNPNSTVAKLTAALTDYFPSGLVVAGSANVRNTCGGTVTASKGSSKVTLTGGSIPVKSSCTVKVDVTAKHKGSYVNKLVAGALRTDKGNNASSASATLTVLAANIAPKLDKAFSPSTIKAGGVSTLTITLINPNSTAAKLTGSLTDYFPGGLVISKIDPKAHTTCGGTVTASKGSSKVVLTGASIPANGSCTVNVNVTAKHKSTYHNKLLVGALKTDHGSNSKAAFAILKVK